MDRPPYNPSLPSRPPRPSAAGPSRPRPPRPQQHTQGSTHGHPPRQQAFSYPPPPQSSVFAQPYPYPNAPGAYQSFANPSGSYQPFLTSAAYTTPFQTYGQSLFPSSPATPDGYSYSQAYTQPQFQADTRFSPRAPAPSQPRPHAPSRLEAPGPAKKQRLNDNSVNSAGGSKPWRNCSQPGCRFVGAGDEVEVHEGDRHLIFPHGQKVEKSEEEEVFARHKGPPPAIQGTGITLHTEEDIAKWVEERKSRWPSSKRVAEKEGERQAAIARGEVSSRGRGGGRGRGAVFGRRNDAASQAEDWGRPVEEPRPQAAMDGRTRGRGRGRGADRGWRGRGRGGHSEGHDSRLAAAAAISQSAPGPVLSASPKSAKAKFNPAVTGLTGLGDYDSDDASASRMSGELSSSDTDSDSSSSVSSSVSNNGTKELPYQRDDDGLKTALTAEGEGVPRIDEGTQPQKPVCRYFAKNGRCRLGDQCKFAHIRSESSSNRFEQKAAPTANRPKQPPPPKANNANAFDRPSMLGALLETPIQNTLSQLSQVIRFLVANDMLEGVELEPGQAEERERERNRIVVLEAETTALTGTPTFGQQSELVEEVMLE